VTRLLGRTFVKELGARRPGDLDRANQAARDSDERMVNELVRSGHERLDFENCCAARRDDRRLDGSERRRGERTLVVDLSQDLPDDVGRRDLVRPADTKENPHCFAGLRMHGVLRGEGVDGAIEKKIFRPLVHQFGHAYFLMP
jgi:hypothetical protein